MTYYKYETKNPKIKKMLLSLAKHTGMIKGLNESGLCEEKDSIGMFYQSDYDINFPGHDDVSRVRGYVKESLVGKTGKDVTLEEIITFILK